MAKQNVVRTFKKQSMSSRLREKRERMGKMADIKQMRMKRQLTLLILLTHSRHTITRLSEILDTSERTIYRLINVMESVGISVDKDFDGKYFIAQATCPVCKAEVHHG